MKDDTEAAIQARLTPAMLADLQRADAAAAAVKAASIALKEEVERTMQTMRAAERRRDIPQALDAMENAMRPETLAAFERAAKGAERVYVEVFGEARKPGEDWQAYFLRVGLVLRFGGLRAMSAMRVKNGLPAL